MPTWSRSHHIVIIVVGFRDLVEVVGDGVKVNKAGWCGVRFFGNMFFNFWKNKESGLRMLLDPGFVFRYDNLEFQKLCDTKKLINNNNI